MNISGPIPAHAPHASSGRARTRRLVGRTPELRAIADQFARTATGHGGVVIIDGEPGVGKTALLDELVRIVEHAHARVLSSAASELDMRTPFGAVRSWAAHWPFDDVAPPKLERARRLMRGEGRAGGDAISWENSVLDIVVDIVERLCAAGPTVVISDDAHWADTSTLRAIERLCEMVDELPLLVVIALRPLPHAGMLADLIERVTAAGATRVRPGPLGERDGAELAADVLCAPVGPGLGRALTWAAGNPLFIAEMVAGLQQAGQLTLEGGGRMELATSAEVGRADPRLPASLTEAILRRLDYLPTNVQRVLSLAAALGVNLEAAELAAVLGAGSVEIDEVVTLATDAGILAAGREGLNFRHDLIRRVFADQVPKLTQASLQWHAAQTLMNTDGPIERIAGYLLSSDAQLDAYSIAWLTGSANRLMICAPEDAVRLLAAAIEADSEADSGPRLRLLLVRALLWSGRAAEAEQAAHAALDRLPDSGDPQRADVLWLLSQACLAQGKVRAAHEVSTAAVLQDDVPREHEARHQGVLAVVSHMLDRLDAAEQAADRAQTLGTELADPVAIGIAQFSLGLVRYYQGHLDECLALGDNLIRQYEALSRGRDSFAHFNPYLVSGQCLIECDQPVRAEQVLTATIDYEDRSGGAMQTANLLAMGRLHFATGRWADALSMLHRACGTPDVYGYARVAPSLIALIAVYQGTFTGTSDSIPPLVDDIAGRTGLHVRAWAQAVALETYGRPAEALDLLIHTCAQVESPWTEITLYYIYPDMARLAAITDRAADLQSIAQAARQSAARIDTLSRKATALLCTGLADKNPDLLTESVELFQVAGRPLYTAHAYESLAAVHAAAGRAAARPALDAAIELYSGLDAEWAIARAEARLRLLGLRYGRRGPRNRPKSGWAALTPTELRVAEFVTQGLSNSQIATRMLLSRRTVQTHVSSILAKLDVESRVQIAVSRAPVA